MTEIFAERRAATSSDAAWLRKSMRRALSAIRLPATFVEDLELVVSEVCANTLSHADQKPLVLGLAIALDGPRIRLTIEDDGEPWRDAQTALGKNAILPGADAESGRGLWLIRQSLDRLSYDPRGESRSVNRFIGWKSLVPLHPTVLVVDDMPALLEMYANYLEPDFRTIAASSLAQAREILRISKIDIVLADVHLDDGLGHELAEHMESLGQNESPPLVLISSDASEMTRADGLRSGAEFFVSKPVRRKELRDIIAMALSRTRLRNARLARSFSRHVDGLVETALPARIGAYRASAVCEPATPGGGDIVMHFALPEVDRIVIIDVMGHGIAARAWAIAYAAIVRAICHCRPHAAPHEFLTEFAGLAWRDPGLQNAMATVLVADFDEGCVTLASAGHPGPAIHDGALRQIAVEGPLLGVMPPQAYGSVRVPLAVGNRLFLLTDGVDPADVAAGGPLPVWLAAAIASAASLPHDEAFTALRHAATAALGPQPVDDWTFVQIERCA